MVPDPDRSNLSPLAIRLRQARETLGMSQLTAAIEAGTTADMVHRWETGKRRPSVKALNKLAGAYGIPVREFVLLWEEQDKCLS